MYKNDLLTKTGSGQTSGKHSKSRPFSQVLFSYLLAHDAQEEVLPSGSDHGAPAVAEPTWARHLGLTLSPAYCFRVAVIPSIVCVLLAMSIPDPREILRMHGVGKAGAIVSKEESEVSFQHDKTRPRHDRTIHDTNRRPHHANSIHV